ncbi:MAG: 3-deoxy-manno-octulosonate cytidylyltransferase [Candidimonas sp.]
MSFIVVIPARMASTRLPDKPLLDIGGRPMVIRTAEQAALSGAQRILIATDDIRVQQAADEYGYESLITRAEHPTGTDRLAQVAQQLEWPDDAVVVNVQADEPLIEPELIDLVAGALRGADDAAIATCAAPIDDAQVLFDPNVVKVVCTHLGRALYFSRAPIPWARDALADGRQRVADGLPALRHIGLYAYRAAFLRAYPSLPPGPLERYESLEQLRAMENGHVIAVERCPAVPAPGVDTPADLRRVREIFANRQ